VIQYHTNVQINRPKLANTQEYGWAITEKIFSYTGLPQVKILQKALGGYFFYSHCIHGTCFAKQLTRFHSSKVQLTEDMNENSYPNAFYANVQIKL